ncbi:unnamed protein product [Lampetra planeri]
MTAKHRKGKSNHKPEENFVKKEVTEPEVRAGAAGGGGGGGGGGRRGGGGGYNPTVVLVLVLTLVVGGAAGAWFCFQQHQTLTYLSENLLDLQVKTVKFQSSLENMRQSSDQVLSLHAELEARLAEMQQSAVSPEHLSQLQSTLEGGGERRGGDWSWGPSRAQVDGLAASGAELSQQVEFLTGSLGDAESELEARAGRFAALGAAVNTQAAEVLGLKELMDAQQALVEANRLEAAAVR